VAVVVPSAESVEARLAARVAVVVPVEARPRQVVRVVPLAQPVEAHPAQVDPADRGRVARQTAALQAWTRAPAQEDRRALVAQSVAGALP
jgi:hypothetical protein